MHHGDASMEDSCASNMAAFLERRLSPGCREYLYSAPVALDLAMSAMCSFRAQALAPEVYVNDERQTGPRQTLLCFLL